LSHHLLFSTTQVSKTFGLETFTIQVNFQKYRQQVIKGENKMENFILKLYVTGTTPNSERAIANLRRLCEEELDEKYEVIVIDVLERPQLAEDEKILATPTLVKALPPPLRRVIGDLSDTEKVLLGLDLRPSTPKKEGRNEHK